MKTKQQDDDLRDRYARGRVAPRLDFTGGKKKKFLLGSLGLEVDLLLSSSVISQILPHPSPSKPSRGTRRTSGVRFYGSTYIKIAVGIERKFLPVLLLSSLVV